MRASVFRAMLASAALAATTPALATNAITSFFGNDIFSAFASDETIGWAFSTDSDIAVTALGWWSGIQFATLADHEVGIWDDSGVLLGSVTVSAGPANDGVWRFAAISPISLSGGATYFIGGRDTVEDGDDYTSNLLGAVFAPGISFIGAAVSSIDAGFAWPSTVSPGVLGRLGPTFRFEPAAAVIPEPASWGMMMLGFGVIGLAMRRRSGRIGPAVTLA